ncbi:Fic/DOC family protein [Bordetella genomosp. 9]|uniref:Fic/DOC family protein n=1 Tax=Bordetella genomosp. 9 TaxID=1416803 RepID=UPI00211AB06F|nr:Fic family protein [Bordetella genomosp. 9]
MEGYAPQITQPLARDRYLRGLNVEEFSRKAGHYLGELNVLHPFRDGNGRAIREFFRQLASEAGYAIQWYGVDRRQWVQASILAYEGDSRPMASLIRENLIDLDQEHAVDLAKSIAGADARIAHAIPGNAYEGTVLGATERYVVQQFQSEGLDVVLHVRDPLVNAEQLVPGRSCEIRYPHGNVGLVRAIAQDTDHDIQQDHPRDLTRSTRLER